MAKDKEKQYATEVIDLPSGGRLYPEGSPLHEGKIEVKYMTAKEEDILTSQNLIKRGVVIDKLLDTLIITPGVTVDNLLIGDKNAVMIAARILAYGPEYTLEIVNPETDTKFEHTFDLSDMPYKELPSDVSYDKNEFEYELPVSKSKVVFRLLTGKDERLIDDDLKSMQKIGSGTSREITTRLRHVITSINGETDKKTLNLLIDNMLAKDSFAFRKRINVITPDILMEQEVDMGGETTTVDIPMTVDFFWPSS